MCFKNRPNVSAALATLCVARSVSGLDGCYLEREEPWYGGWGRVFNSRGLVGITT